MEEKIEKILKELAKNEALIKYHNGWGFYIETNFDDLKMIGLIDKYDRLELSLFFGDSQSQSRAFYNKRIEFERLLQNDWKVLPNFHLSSSYRKNLIWFESNLQPRKYIEFWSKNIGLLHQHKIEELPKLIESLEKEKVIILDEDKKIELDSEIYSSNYTRFNICAGFGLIFSINKEEAFKLSEVDLNQLLIEKINEGLGIINQNGISFLKNDIKADLDGDPPGL